MIEVSMKEWNVLTFVRGYCFRHGFSPTQTEIANGCKLPDRKAVRRVLIDLKIKGLVSYDVDAKKRALRLINVPVGVQP